MSNQTTDFSNDTISTDILPKAEDVVMKPLSASYPTVLIIMSIITTAIPTIVLTALYLLEIPILITKYMPWIYTVAVLFLILGYFWSHLDAKHRGYAIREQDILYRYGVIWHTVIVVPFNRLQHAELHRGPLERLFNLSSLRLFTAGGLKADMTIPALPEEDAVRIREYVLSRVSISI
mgnify:CR=1 FL=1